jgi:hypothetical protein
MDWQPIETAPSDVLVVVGWLDEYGEVCTVFDCMDEGGWMQHNDHYEHYCMVAKGGGDDISWHGPSEKAPYTHWLKIPEFPK